MYTGRTEQTGEMKTNVRCRVYYDSIAVIFVCTTIFYGGNLSPRRPSDFGSLNVIMSVFNSRRTATNRSILPDRPTITSYILHIPICNRFVIFILYI